MEETIVYGTGLNVYEQDDLARHESVIERGLQTFQEVGAALLAIRDGRLYREQYSTFEDYCQERWNMSRSYAHRTIEAAQVARNLLPIGNILPATESQARPLTRLEPELQREAWAEAVETAPNGRVTAAHVEQVVQKYTAPHVSYNSGNNEWYTPPEFIETARILLGAIDLDPASSDSANEVVQAAAYFTCDDDGLGKYWRGRVWMNPPYASDLIGRFCEKLALHYGDGDVTEAVVLVNNATETTWFQTLVDVATAIVFPRGRIRFWKPGGEVGAPLQGQALVYLGERPGEFLRAFDKFGWGAYLETLS